MSSRVRIGAGTARWLQRAHDSIPSTDTSYPRSPDGRLPDAIHYVGSCLVHSDTSTPYIPREPNQRDVLIIIGETLWPDLVRMDG